MKSLNLGSSRSPSWFGSISWNFCTISSRYIMSYSLRLSLSFWWAVFLSELRSTSHLILKSTSAAKCSAIFLYITSYSLRLSLSFWWAEFLSELRSASHLTLKSTSAAKSSAIVLWEILLFFVWVDSYFVLYFCWLVISISLLLYYCWLFKKSSMLGSYSNDCKRA